MDMYYFESGPDDGHTIVFLHGGGFGGWMWKRHVECLKDYHCLIPDMPDHGKSMNTGTFSISNCAEQVAELIRQRAHGGRAHIVGLSLGAQVSVELLSTAPEVVDHVIINSALLKHMPLARVSALSMKYMMPLVRNRSFQKLQAKAYHIPDENFEEYYSYAHSVKSEALERTLLENAEYRLPEGIKGCRVPALIIVGQKEPRVMRESASDLGRALPNARTCIIMGKGHSYALEAPEQYSEIVRAGINDSNLPCDKLKILKIH